MKLPYLIGSLGVLFMFGISAHGSGGNIGSRSDSPRRASIKWEMASEPTGACLYPYGYGTRCDNNVTKAECDRKNGSSWGEGHKCP